MNLSWLSPKAEKRQSSIEGRGLFAKERILKDEVVTVKGGHVFDGKTLKKLQKLGPSYLQIADDLFIGPITVAEYEGSMMHLNHSCNPNLGVRGEITFVAMRDINEGEECTFDYVMTDNEAYRMKCRCGASNCRGTVSGKDWQRKDLQKKYGKYFSAYLRVKFS